MFKKECDWPVFDPAEDGVETLVKLSRYYGRYPGFVIAGGGNSSFKTADKLYVKASGAALATIDSGGFVVLDRGQLDRLLNTQLSADPAEREEQFKQAILAARLEPEKGQRPSVETLLHHLLPAKFVMHSHATLVNTMTCCARGEQVARELFGDDMLWVPFVDPGYVLARHLVELLGKYQAATGRATPKIILLANHGLIVAGDTPEEIRAVTEEILAKISGRLGANWQDAPFGTGRPADEPAGLIPLMDAELPGLLADASASKLVLFDDSPLVRAFVGTDAAKTLPLEGPLNPDQIVYCNSYPLYFAPPSGGKERVIVDALRQAVAGHQKQYGYLPRVILVRGVGLFACGDDRKSASSARDLYKDAIEILAGAMRLGGPTFLTPQQRKFIEEWEVEAYRRQVV